MYTYVSYQHDLFCRGCILIIPPPFPAQPPHDAHRWPFGHSYLLYHPRPSSHKPAAIPHSTKHAPQTTTTMSRIGSATTVTTPKGNGAPIMPVTVNSQVGGGGERVRCRTHNNNFISSISCSCSRQTRLLMDCVLWLL